jgi:hypothetical protein
MPGEAILPAEATPVDAGIDERLLREYGLVPILLVD